MNNERDEVRTFRIRMRTMPVLKSTLLVMAEQPEEAQALAGVDLTSMAIDLLSLLTEAEHETYDKHAETPMSPKGEAPLIEVDLDRAEAIAIANSLMAVRQTTSKGPMDKLMLKAMVNFYPQIPSKWADDSGEPLAEVIESVKKYVEVNK